ncbi:MAG: phenylalanine--tRNA ligase subunit beta, partial [Candidatus Nitrosomaritimum yanchengensis]
AALKTGFDLQIETKTTTHETFEKGRTASILINGKTVGVIGEINSKTIENYKIRVPVTGFEISLSGLIFD